MIGQRVEGALELYQVDRIDVPTPPRSFQLLGDASQHALGGIGALGQLGEQVGRQQMLQPLPGRLIPEMLTKDVDVARHPAHALPV